MKHLMIDLETLGTAVNAPIVAIGAVFFDPATGAQGATFDAAIDVADAMRYGRADGNTIKWWLQQGDKAREKVARGKSQSQKVFEAFYTFCAKSGDAKVWGNGSSFDISLLEYAFPRIIEKPAPWKFWNVRDCRTIKDLAEGVVPYNGKLAGVAHTALDDAKHQAEWVSIYWQGLRGIRKASAGDDILDL